MRVARCQHFADDSIIPHYLYNVQTTAGRRRRDRKHILSSRNETSRKTPSKRCV
jgi:hypothetical protein